MADLRARLTAAELRSATGKTVFGEVVRSGLYRTAIYDSTIGDVSVQGDRASAPMTMEGTTIPQALEFRYEKGAWRAALVPMLHSFSRAMVEEYGEEIEADILEVHSEEIDRVVTTEIYDTPLE